MYQSKQELIEEAQKRFYIILISFCALLLVALVLLWNPLMKPWTQERLGYANLLKAQFENKIQAEQSAAERDAASLRAQAIAIVGDVARKFPEYRAQEFIGGFADALKNEEISQTFYIPTRAAIPILPDLATPHTD